MPNYHSSFQTSLENIDKLVRTPNLVKEFALNGFASMKPGDFSNTGKAKFDNIVTALSNISDPSIQRSYDVIYNQTCVLAVSALSAILEKYFKNYANNNWSSNIYPENIKLSLLELGKYDLNLKPHIGKIILEKDNSINFQDLQSAVRAFEQYLSKVISLADDEKGQVIFFQQCRHILVHNDGVVNQLFIKRVGGCNLKNYKEGDKIQLNEGDWFLIKQSFTNFINKAIPTSEPYSESENEDL